MYLKNDKIVVTVKNLVFRSYRTGGGAEFVLDPTALTGWDDGTNVRRSSTVRPVSSGDFVEPYTFASRLISITGTALATSRGELQRMRDALTGMISHGEYTEIKVETTGSTRFATVGLENSISWVQQVDNIALFRVEFYAPDPHIYGVENKGPTNSYVRSGGIEFPLEYPLFDEPTEENVRYGITNHGNAIAYPKFVVTGNYYNGFSISSGFGGKTVTYSGMVTQSSPVTIDMAKGTATQGGVDKTVLMTRRGWFGVPPNTSLTPIFSPEGESADYGGQGWCDIIYRDTWI